MVAYHDLTKTVPQQQMCDTTQQAHSFDKNNSTTIPLPHPSTKNTTRPTANPKTHKKQKTSLNSQPTHETTTPAMAKTPSLLETQCKYQPVYMGHTWPNKPVYMGRMRPNKQTKHHPAHPILETYAMQGCPVNCRAPWMQDHLEAAINRGNHHTLANTPEAQKLL